MSTFWDLLKQSIITQAILTIVIVVVDCYMIIAGRTIPAELWAITSLVIGFYFGSKVGNVQGLNQANAAKRE